jgi:tRNA nucleotidyltransferase (CCA-adding enzyme)
MIVGKRGHRYPQVEPGAAALVDAPVAAAPAALTVREAMAVALKRDAHALRLGDRGWVLREDLARAATLALEDLPASAITRPLPMVSARASEVAVRRALAAGARLVIVQDRRGLIGGVSAASGLASAAIGLSVAARLSRSLPPWTSDVLATVGRLATAAGARAFLVGGVVRDVLRAAVLERADLDVVVEGDGIGLARELGAALGASVVEHVRFLTASLRRASGERIDVATARTERYEAPGALPRVLPASLSLDLGRRDFTINAMAVEIAGGDMRLCDPHGGRGDLARRRLRILHPLSFVDDPTRIVRGARYAARLDLTYDGWTAACQALALRLGAYPALSGQRIAAELERLLDDARPEVALRRLGTAGAFRLLDPRYRFTRAAGDRIGAATAAWAWARERALDVSRLELTLVALLADQPRDVGVAAMRRLGLSGEPLARASRCLATVDTLAARLAQTAAGAARARLLRECSDLELAAARLSESPAARAALDWWVERGRRVRPALRGEEVVELGVRRGPAVAEVLDGLRDRRLDGEVDDREAEIEYVRHWLRARGEG